MLRIATVNVNGIRAAQRRGFGAWLTATNPDIVALQEVRCPERDLPEDAFGGYHAAYDSGVRAGRNGVAVLTRHAPVAVRTLHSDGYDRPVARELRAAADHTERCCARRKLSDERVARAGPVSVRHRLPARRARESMSVIVRHAARCDRPVVVIDGMRVCWQVGRCDRSRVRATSRAKRGGSCLHEHSIGQVRNGQRRARFP